jgi:anti-sigma regulatory factor (Ser/Thr protein kinase)
MEIRLEIPNRNSEYEPARDRLVELFHGAGLAEDVVGELELVLEEVLVNVISYAYGEAGSGTIRVWAAVDDGTVTLEFRDRGCPFDPLARDTPELDLPIDSRPVGGLGIFLVTQLATRVSYERVEGENVLTVVKET